MSDRELLELAAKAAGIDAHVTEWSSTVEDDEGDYLKPWNPLTDDGDALRLAVKLGLLIDTHGLSSRVALPYQSDWTIEKHGTDPLAATRRAIVRAAAEIGRDMK